MGVLDTSYERNGFDGTWGKSQWWIESWGSGKKENWNLRSEAGAPTPRELRRADYIVIGIRHPNGAITYRTHMGGLDLDARIRRA